MTERPEFVGDPTLNNRDGSKMTPTFREKLFLDRLGEWSRCPHKPEGTGLSRLELLKRYRDTQGERRCWAGIDEMTIEEYVDELIRQETGRIPRRKAVVP